MTEFLLGTSGYAYREWKGKFYPAKISPDDMLGYYGERFSAVEMNNTFYHLPKADVVKEWARQVPASFRFAIKAPQTITHRKRLKNAKAETDELLRTIAVLKRRLGPVLFQLPPNMKIDLPRLDDFLTLLARRVPAAVEFRHASWLNDDVYACLRRHRAALCIADAEDLPAVEPIDTADWGYVRLRREDYTDRQLRAWITKLRAQKWKRAYVFFKHEETGSGPRLAARFAELAASSK